MSDGEKSAGAGSERPFQFVARWEEGIEHQARARPLAWLALVVSLAVAISLFSKFPVYADASQPPATTFATFQGTPLGAATSWWLDHPFQPVSAADFFPPEMRQDATVVGTISHFDKLTFRALLPLLNRVFHGGFWTLVVANHLAVLSIFVLLYVLVRRQTGDVVLASLLVWAYAAGWAGGWGFNDMVCGDTVAVALMLGVMAAPGPGLAGCLLVAAAFTDERAILAAPLLGLFRCWSANSPWVNDATPGRPRIVRAFFPLVAGIGVYAAIRIAIGAIGDVHSGTSMIGGTTILLYHCFVSFPGKIFGVFEFLWVFPLGLAAALLGAPGAAGRQGLAFMLALGCATAPALMVWDIERSLTYLLPAVLLGVCFFPGNPLTLRRLLWAATFAGFLWLQVHGSILRYVLL